MRMVERAPLGGCPPPGRCVILTHMLPRPIRALLSDFASCRYEYMLPKRDLVSLARILRLSWCLLGNIVEGRTS
jgi:hypothetical protein